MIKVMQYVIASPIALCTVFYSSNDALSGDKLRSVNDMPPRLQATLNLDEEVRQSGEEITLTLDLFNPTLSDVLIISHYLTSTINHFDNIELQIIPEMSDHVIRVPLSGPREATSKIGCYLGAGQHWRQSIVLNEWLSINHIELDKGSYTVSAQYSVTKNEGTGPVVSMCKDIGLPAETVRSVLPTTLPPPWHGILRTNAASIVIR